MERSPGPNYYEPPSYPDEPDTPDTCDNCGTELPPFILEYVEDDWRGRPITRPLWFSKCPRCKCTTVHEP